MSYMKNEAIDKINDLPPVVSIYKHDDLKVMISTRGHNLDDVLEGVENALRGSGFFFDGSVGLVDEN